MMNMVNEILLIVYSSTRTRVPLFPLSKGFCIKTLLHQENRNDLVGWRTMTEAQLFVAYENTIWPVAPSEGAKHSTSVVL